MVLLDIAGVIASLTESETAALAAKARLILIILSWTTIAVSTGSVSLIQYTSDPSYITRIGPGAPWAANPPGAQWIAPYIVDFYVDKYAESGQYGNLAGLLVDVTSTTPAVPEPSTILSGLLLAMPLGASTLRNLRKKTAA